MKKRLLAVLAVLLLALAVDAQWAHVTTGTQRGGACDLCTDLVSYWPLDEVAGQRNDIKGTNHLTDNNTVGSAAGKHNNAASFVLANTESLTRNYDACGAGAWTVAAWMYNTDGSGANNSELFLSQDLVGAWGWRYTGAVSRAAFSNNWRVISGDATATYSGSLDSAWHLMIGWFDPATGKTYISVDNGAPIASPLARTTAQVASITAIGSTFGGLIDEGSIWSAVLDAPRRTELWNAGVGKFYDGTKFADLFRQQPWRYAKADWFLSRPPAPSVSLRDCPRTRATTSGGWR